ncbi:MULTISPECIES: hypothetical protein [Halomonadaceae]|uniref:hypothetical protein n=1 Tax=Halomonadaceae TaxID=28256 RepID=UPI00159960EC|nr:MULTISPECIES: hypothetical protein [Halomonas]QJQ93903.1 hypothetical protein HIO72_00405 [Halomonas sp. PA5]
MNAANRPRWSDIAQHPSFQNASPEKRREMQQGYFQQFIQPSIPEGLDASAVHSQFLEMSSADLGDTSPGVLSYVARTPQMVAEGAVGSLSAAAEGVGVIGEQMGRVESDRRVDEALQRLDTTERNYAEALEGTNEQFRDRVTANFERDLERRQQELHDAITDWAEREPSQVAQFFRDRGTDLRELAQEIGPDEEFDGLYRELANGVGSMLTYMGPGMVAGALTRGASTGAQMAAGLTAAGALAGPSGVSDQYNRAIAAGQSEEEALEVAMQGLPGGLIQVAPLASIIRPLPAELQGKAIGQLYGILRTAGSEFVVENAGAMLQNLVEQSYNEEKSTWDDTPYQGLVAGGSAAILQAGVQALTRGRGMSASPGRAGEQRGPDAPSPDAVQEEAAEVAAEPQAAPETDPTWAQAWQEQGVAQPAENLPDTTIEIQPGQQEDSLSALIRTPLAQLDPASQQTRDQILAGDGYALLRERAEATGNPDLVASVDRMQVSAMEANAAPDAATAQALLEESAQRYQAVTAALQQPPSEAQRQASQQQFKTQSIAAAREQVAAQGGDALAQTVAGEAAEQQAVGQVQQEEASRPRVAPDTGALGQQIQQAMATADQLADAARTSGQQTSTRQRNLNMVIGRAETAFEQGNYPQAESLLRRADAIANDLGGTIQQAQQIQQAPPAEQPAAANVPQAETASQGELAIQPLPAQDVATPPQVSEQRPAVAATTQQQALRSNGEPFATERSAMASGAARRAQAQGQIVEAVPVEGGFAVRMQDAAQIAEATGETAQDAFETIRGDSIDSEWTEFSDTSGTLNIPRTDMPQIKAEHRGALANFLSARGIVSSEETVPARSLHPTQREFSEERVQAAKDREGGDRAILVSADGHVVDGHHQWLARADQGQDVRVIRLDAPIEQVLEAAHTFPSSETDGGATNREAPAQESFTADEQAIQQDGQDSLFSTREAEPVATTTPLAEDIRAEIARLPELAEAVVIQHPRELPSNALLSMAMRGVNARDVRGMYFGGDLYVIASNLESVEEGVRVAIHEAVGHKGVRGVLGAELEPVMREVYRTLPLDRRGREALQEVLDAYTFLDRNNPDHQITIAEEMIAHLTEKGWTPGPVRRAIAKIRELLRRYFPNMRWTDTDVMALAERSREYLRRQQEEADGATDLDAVDSEVDSTQSDSDTAGSSESDALMSMRSQSSAPGEMRAAIEALKGVGRPIVLNSADNLALNVALESTVSGVNPQDAVAFYHGDDLYVIAGNAGSPAQAVRATLATVISRNGLREVVGNRVDTVLRDVYRQLPGSQAGRAAMREIRAEYDYLDQNHDADRMALTTELVARMNERGDAPGFIREAGERLDALLQEAYPEAGFSTGDGVAMATHSRHHLRQQQTDFGEKRAPYALPFVFSAQDGAGRGTLLDLNTQVVDENGDIVSDARVDTSWQSVKKVGQGFFESATDRLRRSRSPVLVELATRVDAYFDQAEARLGMVNGMLREPLKKLRTLNPLQRSRNMTAFEQYMRHRDNGRKAQADAIAADNPAVTELAEAVDAMFDEVGTLNQNVKTPQGTGMRVFDSRTGAFRKIGKVKKGEFWPRAIRPEVQRVMHDPTSNTKLWHELLDALIDEGKAESRKEAAEYLRGNSGYFSSEIASDYFAGIEKARGEKLPEIFYDYRFDVVSNYARKWSNRISQVEQFGQKIGPMAKDAFEEAVSVARDQQTKDYIGALADRVYNRRPIDGYHEGMAMANLAATGLQLGNPGTATLNIIGGTQLNVQMFGSKRMAKAYLELATEFRDVYREGVELGILGKDVLNILRDADNRNAEYMDANSRAKEGLSKFAAFTMKWGGYTGTEQVIRATGMLAARAQLLDALKVWNTNPFSRDARTYRAFMDRNRIDVGKLIRENGKGEESAKYLRLMVNIPQGSYRVDQTPLYVDTPIGRFMFKYQKFGTQVSRLFWQQKLKPMMDTWADPSATSMDRARATLPILQWFGWSIIGGGAILSARGAMFGYLNPGPELEEIAKAMEDDDMMSWLGMVAAKAHANMIAGSAYGFFGNYIQMGLDIADQQRVKNPFEPPGLAPVDAAVELVRRGLEQGRFPYASDFEQVAERNVSLYRASKRGLAAIGRQAGVEADFIALEQARRDLQYVRKAARRFADDTGIDATRTATGRFGLTENTAANRKIVDALLIGNGRQARQLVMEELRSLPKDERNRRLQSIRSTARARQPVQLGGPASQEEVAAFRAWAKQRLPPSRAQLVEEMIVGYERSTRQAGL